MSEPPLSVSLIEDQSESARIILDQLERVVDLRIVSHHFGASDALEQLPRLRPDIILVDLNLGAGKGGIECIRTLKPLLTRTAFIVLTQFDDGDRLFASLLAGADSYLLKRDVTGDLAESIREVSRGGSVISPSVARKVLDWFARIPVSTQASAKLSLREIQLLQLAQRGQTAKGIACSLGLTYPTVRAHLRNVYRKLHVHTLQEALKRTFLAPGK